ncbi:MAG: hypothetical protein R6U44_05070 [Archaeoglobaceae archaeon]
MKGVRKVVALLLVLAMLGTIVSPVMATDDAGNTKTKPIPAKEEDKPNKNAKILIVDQAIKEATPYWILLAASKKEQKVLFEYIDNCNLTEEETERMKEFMSEMWNEYPVKFVKRGKVTTIIFDTEESNVKLTEDENAMLGQIAKAVIEYKESNTGSGEIGILWYGSTHRSIAYISCIKWGEDDYAGVARDYADDPDQWAQIPPPPGYPDWWWDFIMQVIWSWTHYYNPDTWTGGAPGECDYYADEAKDYYSSGSYYSAFKNLGYSSHFLTDVGQPLHTGLESWQALYRSVHFDYEEYVMENWETGYNFKSVIDDNCITTK